MCVCVCVCVCVSIDNLHSRAEELRLLQESLDESQRKKQQAEEEMKALRKVSHNFIISCFRVYVWGKTHFLFFLDQAEKPKGEIRISCVLPVFLIVIFFININFLFVIFLFFLLHFSVQDKTSIELELTKANLKCEQLEVSSHLFSFSFFFCLFYFKVEHFFLRKLRWTNWFLRSTL